MSTVWKVVDDKDSRIEYSGQWTSVTGDTKLSDGSDTLDGLSRSGSVFGNTVHGTRTNGTGVTFRFNGTSLAAVYASVAFDSFVGQGDQVVMIDCFLDGKEATGSGYIPSSVPRPINNQPACSVYADSYKGTLSPGEHELSLNVTRISNASFYVDYVVYEALADAPIDGEILRIGDGQMNMRSSPDPHLSFGAGWETGNGGMVSTVTPGSSVTVRFNGTGIQLYGDLNGTSSNSATYQLDNDSPQQFVLFPIGLTNLEDSASIPTNQLLFNLSSIPPLEHTLVVTHNGSESGMPLVIDYFLVTSLTSDEQASLSSSGSSVSQTPGTSESSGRSSAGRAKGAIIGGSIGGLVLLGLVGCLVLSRIKKGKNRRQLRTDVPRPFTELSPTTPVSTPTQTTSKSSLMGRGEDLSDLSSSTAGSPDLRHRNEEVNTMRLGYLKLQQQLAVLRNGSDTARGMERPGNEEQSSRVVHTDSGWRMPRDREMFSNPNDMTEVPPNYTEV